MTAIPSRTETHSNPDNGNDSFLRFLPTVRRHAEFSFRRLDDEARDEAVAETVAAAFCIYAHTRHNGKEHIMRRTPLARFAVRDVRNGRHVGGSWESKRDVMSRVAQRRNGFRVYSLPLANGRPFDCMTAPDQPVWKDHLLYDRRTLPVDLAAFRIDWSYFMAKQHDRTRTLLAMLAAGHKQVEVADHLGVTPSAVCQRRTKAAREWAVFQGEDVDETAADAESNAAKPASPVKTGPIRVAAKNLIGQQA